MDPGLTLTNSSGHPPPPLSKHGKCHAAPWQTATKHRVGLSWWNSTAPSGHPARGTKRRTSCGTMRGETPRRELMNAPFRPVWTPLTLPPASPALQSLHPYQVRNSSSDLVREWRLSETRGGELLYTLVQTERSHNFLRQPHTYTRIGYSGSVHL